MIVCEDEGEKGELEDKRSSVNDICHPQKWETEMAMSIYGNHEPPPPFLPQYPDHLFIF